jgi:hypothetical protein
MTINICDDDTEGMKAELEYVEEQAPTWVAKALRSENLWDKLSNITFAEMHDALQIHLGDADYLLLFDFALAVTAIRRSLMYHTETAT